MQVPIKAQSSEQIPKIDMRARETNHVVISFYKGCLLIKDDSIEILKDYKNCEI